MNPEVRARLLEMFRKNPSGLTTQQLEAVDIGGSGADSLMQALNGVLAERLVGVFTRRNMGVAEPVLRLISGEEHLVDLAPEQQLVFQEISKAGNVGIWKKTLKSTTGLSEGEIKKVIKHLQTQNLIKEVKSVVHKAKKIYMLACLEPAKEVTGGAWYTDLEMDHEFVDGIRQQVMTELDKGPKTARDLKEIAAFVHGTSMAWSHTDDSLGLSEFRSILCTLLYDGLVEEGGKQGRAATGGGDVDPVYRIIASRAGGTAAAAAASGGAGAAAGLGAPLPNALFSTPCGTCPVFSKCSPDGVISPKTCVYLDAWLDF